MLHEFLKSNRTELITRCQAKAAKRALPNVKPPVMEFGIPQFLAQLIETLRVEQTPEALARHKASGHRRPSLVLVPPVIPSTAAKHGEEMRRQGLTIDQVVHGYGDLCQALTELALEVDAPISVDEFHTFNRCLDDAISDAVTAYAGDEGHSIPKTDVRVANEQPQSPIQDMRTLLETAMVSFAAIKGGQVGVQGTTSTLHERSLVRIRDLLDRALADERTDADVKRS
jgi:hypothetical protein